MTPPIINHHQRRRKFDNMIVIFVGIGSSAPRPVNRSAKTGITKVRMTQTTTQAMTMTATG